MLKVVGIGEYIISDNRQDILKTFGLGSCVALTIYCPLLKILGMAHIVLPDSGYEKTAGNRPAFFADQAVPLMVKNFLQVYGCPKNNLQVNLFGGADSNVVNDIFNIGSKNLTIIKLILQSYNLVYNDRETGGQKSRTIEIDVATGGVKIETYSMKS